MANRLTDAAVRTRFIEAYGVCGIVTQAAAAAGISSDHVRGHRQRHPGFAAECAAAVAGKVRAKQSFKRLTAPRRAAFLEALAHAGSVTAACLATGIFPGAVYAARRADAAFAADWADAREHAMDRVEDKLFEASLNGFVETIEKDGVTTTRHTQRPAAMFKLLAMRRRAGRSGSRMVELTPALRAASRAKYDAALRLAAETGELPPPPLATLPPPTVTAI